MQPVAKSRSGFAPVRGRLIRICLGRIALTWFVFGQTLKHGFIDDDDPDYVDRNATVMAGVRSRGILTVFTHNYSSNWHPVTMLSHMLDCQTFGLTRAAISLYERPLHTLAVILLFLFLCCGTGALWRSAFVAALFAIHPPHVDQRLGSGTQRCLERGLFHADAPRLHSLFRQAIACRVCKVFCF